jgi:hypothetical protein
MTAFIITNIEWDTDDVPVDNLPVFANVLIDDLPTGTTDAQIEEILSDWLSDSVGYAVFGFDYEQV